MEFEKIRPRIEKIFEVYRKHKYYTTFMSDYYTNITSQIDEVGGGKTNLTSDKVAHAAIKIAQENKDVINFVDLVELAVEQLPKVEKVLITCRYMSKDYKYINDRNVFKEIMCISPKTYRNIRESAFKKLHVMLVTKNYPLIP